MTNCPSCNGASRTVDNHHIMLAGVPTMRRRRKCKACGHAWSTVEISTARERQLRLDALRAVALSDNRSAAR